MSDKTENAKEFVDAKDSEVGVVQISSAEDAIEAVVDIMVKVEFNHKMMAETIRRVVMRTIRGGNRKRAVDLVVRELDGEHSSDHGAPLKRLVSLVKQMEKP
jgi:hypothetical protein